MENRWEHEGYPFFSLSSRWCVSDEEVGEDDVKGCAACTRGAFDSRVIELC